MTRAELSVQRITHVDAALAHQLNALFDDDNAWNADQGARYLANPDNALFVAFDGAQAVGFLTAHRLARYDDRRAEVLLYEIGVDESFQRRGFARALIDACKAWARSVEANMVWVLTERSNAPAMALYAAVGGFEDPPDEVVLFNLPLA